jgi:small subunit ribosomal protein S7
MSVKSTRVTGPGVKPDARYQNELVSKFINCIMLDGKKSTAENIFYGALDVIGKRVGDVEPVEVFQTAINNIKPLVEVKSKRVGGATYQVPVEVGRKRQITLAIRWVLAAVRGRRGRPMHQRLAAELLDAYRKEGAAMTQRENTHKMAEANKAFAHFAW